MKLPNFYAFEPLNELKARMSIPKDVYGTLDIQISRTRLTPGELKKLTSGRGIDVNLDEVLVHSDGTLIYKDHRVLLYIRDVHRYGGRASLPRYHVANCSTLKHMGEIGRSARYVISARTDGIFSLNIFDPSRTEREEHLAVCQNCLAELCFDGFRIDLRSTERKSRVAAFTPERFFEKYPRSLNDMGYRHETVAPVDQYPDNWQRISRIVREAASWRCADCRYDLSPAHLRSFLHVHHKDGDRSHNASTNLIALCIECHAKQAQHSHLRGVPDYRKFQSLKSGRLP